MINWNIPKFYKTLLYYVHLQLWVSDDPKADYDGSGSLDKFEYVTAEALETASCFSLDRSCSKRGRS